MIDRKKSHFFQRLKAIEKERLFPAGPLAGAAYHPAASIRTIRTPWARTRARDPAALPHLLCLVKALADG